MTYSSRKRARASRQGLVDARVEQPLEELRRGRHEVAELVHPSHEVGPAGGDGWRLVGREGDAALRVDRGQVLDGQADGGLRAGHVGAVAAPPELRIGKRLLERDGIADPPGVVRDPSAAA